MTGQFARVLRAEWTKFRTVRGWVVATAVAAVLIVGLGVAPGMGGTCGTGCRLPVGPEGQEVTDNFRFVHRALTGDGSITARLTALTGEKPSSEGPSEPGLVSWAKAGLILKDGTDPGSSYVAVMLTGAHGVRLQYDYVHDVAGPAGDTAPQWLRLTRTGDTVTAAVSADGARWQTVGQATLPNLPETLEAGMFTTSPQYAEVSSQSSFGTTGAMGGPSTATGVFDQVRLEGDAEAAWSSDQVGGPDRPEDVPTGGGPDEDGDTDRAAGADTGSREEGGVFTLTGSGDIAPAVTGAAGLGTSITQTLVGTFAGLVLFVVVGVLFVTAEYRRGLIGTTLAAGPPRGRMLVAKALVVGAVTAITGAVAAAAVLTLGQRVLRGNGVYVHAASTATEVRIVLGTAVLLAVCAVLALALGVVLRRGAVALTVVLAITVLPYLLAMSVLPADAADWVLRITPAAAFAVQQSAVEYAQVDNLYLPVEGYFPLPPAGGLAVLLAWAAAAFTLATVVLRRRDV
ncbi:ABC transporter permease subunit [Cryptosporangium aurantiacum]|uniref:ABC-2 family transporter protein n=1 Tax=Cryptosporangium aurantiacum TaxID=134849 RepID=A0A1M7TWS3_9ACTN|nr:ABC transporter permease subunit [Cryptosporangium aurantiacum]SHN75189.1 ABC-2 family transporter protein [Cryptosporangium aurantiacum]